jgi:hypothetical protein
VWHNAPDNAPEIQAVVAAIAKTGCDFFIDMHGDETRPFIWLVGPALELNKTQAAKQNQFVEFLDAKYPELLPAPEEILSGTMPAPGLSVNYIFRTYGCPGWVVELPFREPSVGDTLLAEGCLNFGHNCVEALLDVMN